jgi:signal transduction histidine kinase
MPFSNVADGQHNTMSDPPAAGGRPSSERRQIVLEPVPASARIARELVRSVTEGADDGRAALIVTELVSNAVGHARFELGVCVQRDGATLWVEVTDDGPGWPELRSGDVHDLSGRGLFLVDQLADTWGVLPIRDPPGKTVWAKVLLTR